MSDSHRGNFRTRGGGGRGGNRNDGNDRDHSHRDGRGRGRGGGGNRDNRTGPGSSREGGEEKERPKRDNILDLNKYINEKMRIKFSGGREVVGLLKGFDQLMNLVLDEVEEVMRGEFAKTIFGKSCEDAQGTVLLTCFWVTDEEGNEGKRSLGLIVARGPLVTLISPFKGSEEIANPFVQADDEEVMEGGE